MYLRTIQRRNADGSSVRYYQLAENVWDPQKRCAVAKVIYSFGRADQVDRDSMQRLARSVLRVFSSEEALAAEPDVRVLSSLPYGGAYVLDALWTELEISKVIAEGARRLKTRQPFERALFAMVANKALQPYSKLYCHDQWLSEEVFFPGKENLQLQHLYRAMDFLEANKQEIERAIYFRMAERRGGDTWRNILAQLDAIKVIDYERGSAHVRQTTEIRSQAADLLRRLQVAPPPRLHHVGPAPSA